MMIRMMIFRDFEIDDNIYIRQSKTAPFGNLVKFEVQETCCKGKAQEKGREDHAGSSEVAVLRHPIEVAGGTGFRGAPALDLGPGSKMVGGARGVKAGSPATGGFAMTMAVAAACIGISAAHQPHDQVPRHCSSHPL